MLEVFFLSLIALAILVLIFIVVLGVLVISGTIAGIDLEDDFEDPRK